MIVRFQSRIRKVKKGGVAKKFSVSVLLLLFLFVLGIPSFDARAGTSKETGHTGSPEDPVVTGSKSLYEYLYDTYWTSGRDKVAARKALYKDYPVKVDGKVQTYYVRVGTTKSSPLSIEDQTEDEMYIFWVSQLDRALGDSKAEKSYDSDAGKIVKKSGSGTYYNTFGFGIQDKVLENSKVIKDDYCTSHFIKDSNGKKIILWKAGSGWDGPYLSYSESSKASDMKKADVDSFWFATASDDRASDGACVVYYAKYSALYKILENNWDKFKPKSDEYSDYRYYSLFLNGLPSIRKSNAWHGV